MQWAAAMKINFIIFKWLVLPKMWNVLMLILNVKLLDQSSFGTSKESPTCG